MFERRTLDLGTGFAVLATWAMTLFIQRATYRDMQAVHAKLDELLRVEGAARTDLAKIDKKDAEEIEDASKELGKY